MTDREQAFMATLWTIQTETGLTDTALADRLGIERTIIPQTKRRGTLGKTLLVAACDQYPHLRELFFELLVTSGNEDNADEHEEHRCTVLADHIQSHQAVPS